MTKDVSEAEQYGPPEAMRAARLDLAKLTDLEIVKHRNSINLTTYQARIDKIKQSRQKYFDELKLHQIKGWDRTLESKKHKYRYKEKLLSAELNFAGTMLRSFIISNGGGLFAILGYYSRHLFFSGAQVNFHEMRIFGTSAFLFAFGLIFGLFSAGAAYLSQVYFNRVLSEGKKETIGHHFRLLSILLGVFSLLFFSIGLILAVSEIKDLAPLAS